MRPLPSGVFANLAGHVRIVGKAHTYEELASVLAARRRELWI